MELEIKKLTKRYGDNTVVDGIDMKIADGEFVVFLGPSGCGKTTTLMMIAGLIEPSAGDVWFDGKSVLKTHPKEREFVFYLNQHHLVTDGWSVMLIVQQLSELYERSMRGELDGPPQPVMKSSFQLRAYSWAFSGRWRRSCSAGSRVASQSSSTDGSNPMGQSTSMAP